MISNNFFDFIKHISGEGVRVLPLKPKEKVAILPNWQKQASANKDQIDQWFKNTKNNAGILTGMDNKIVVIDIDPKNGGYGSLENLDNEIGSIKDLSNFIGKTGSGGLHIYFAYPENLSIKSRINFLPGIDIKADGGYVVCPYSIHPNGNTYEPLIDHVDKNLYVDQLKPLPEKLLQKLVEGSDRDNLKKSDRTNSSVLNDVAIKEGGRNNQMHRIASALRPYLYNPESILLALKNENQFRCIPPLPESELLSIIKSVEKYPVKVELESISLREDAFYGLAGKLAQEVAPISGVSKEALLYQFLVCIGSICGPKFFYSIGGKKINPSDYLIVLGSTGASKKGTSFGDVKWFFDKYYPEFSQKKLKTGVNSGEGLINCIRDRVVVKEKDKTGKEIEVVKDEGALSKIVLFLETEFSRLLKAGKRDGSTVTEIYRNAWDQVPLEINTSQRSIRSTDYSVSLIAHITPKEFKSLVSEIDSSNGYLNRFMFCLIGSAEPRPFPTSFEKVDFSFSIELISVLCLINSLENEELVLADSAKSLYEEYFNEYHYRAEDELSELTSRNIPHLLKMAMIYAILDQSFEIKIEHLKAAKALVDFSEASIRNIFKDKMFSRKEMKVLKFLGQNSGHILRSKIQSDCFKNNSSKDELDLIRDKLINCGKLKIINNDLGESWELLTAKS